MKINIKLFSLLVVLLANTTVAQTTSIPDENFEQALIDMNIDSDEIVNGQVLTSDIENIVELDFGDVDFDDFITDLAGIEDFFALEILDLNHFYINFLDDTQTSIFSNNTNLKVLKIDNLCGDCFGSNIDILDLSSLPNLELIDLTHVPINILKLNNPNFELSNLTLDLYHEGFPGGDWTQHICIEVADPQVATNNQFPYNTWNIIVNDFTTTYGFDDTCNLSVNDFETLTSISVYPNPVQDKLWLDNPNQINISRAEIYNLSGQVVGSYSLVNDFIDVGNLEAGVYFVRAFSKHSSNTFKVLKN